MAKNDKSKLQQKGQKQETAHANQDDLFFKFEKWFEKHNRKIFYLLLFLSTLFSLLLFDSKVSEGGDDSGYIQRAWQFIHEGKFPYFQGPGYSVSLALFVKIFGLNVIALKFFSVLCQLGFVWFTYKAFEKRIPYTVLFALIAFISFNHYVQYYASQTFTEAFFLFIQAVCVYVLFRVIDAADSALSLLEGAKKNYLHWLAFGIVFVFLSISKSIAFVSIVGVVAYFLSYKKYKQALYAIIAFAIIRVIYQLTVTVLFGPEDTSQLEMMLRKEIYRPAAGHEDIAGLFARFFKNFNTYISLHMYRLMNIRSQDALTVIPGLAFVSAIVLGICTFVSYKNKYVFFTSVYLIVLSGGIFFGVQAGNMQDRLIIIVIPFIFLVLFFGVYQLAKKSSFIQTIMLAFAGFMILVTIGKSTMVAQKNFPALKKNLAGDIYYGYTPDWQNFLKMSKYCADSLPDSTQVLSRKPNMSFIYGNGKKFVGQYWVTTTNADSVGMEWKAKKIEYIILPNLRMNPKKNNGKIINTIHRMLAPYAIKYPQRVKLVKTIGTIEKCELYSIKYE